jgi:hypothetical protein
LRKICEAAHTILEKHAGDATTPEAASAAHSCASDATDAISAAHSRDAAPLSSEMMSGLADALCGAMEAAFPGGVPEKSSWAEAVKEAGGSGSEWMPTAAELCKSIDDLGWLLVASWWAPMLRSRCTFTNSHVAGLAKRMFERGTKLSDRIGTNEKTRITVRALGRHVTYCVSPLVPGSSDTCISLGRVNGPQVSQG